SLAKVAGFQEERLPAHAGKTSKRKLKRTVFEHESFRNCRIYRRSRDGWREENIGVGQSVLHAKPSPALPLRTSGGGGGAFVGNTYNRQAHSFSRHGKLFSHTMENRLKTFVFSLLKAVGSGLLSGARRTPCEL
ncbi:MAG TPA: hypothetical protein PLJ99_10560, partial [Kiritimatiellia bacterium]|nr:hypothetical protein [Kiritimatiellia bacterium]